MCVSVQESVGTRRRHAYVTSPKAPVKRPLGPGFTPSSHHPAPLTRQRGFFSLPRPSIPRPARDLEIGLRSFRLTSPQAINHPRHQGLGWQFCQWSHDRRRNPIWGSRCRPGGRARSGGPRFWPRKHLHPRRRRRSDLLTKQDCRSRRVCWLLLSALCGGGQGYGQRAAGARETGRQGLQRAAHPLRG